MSCDLAGKSGDDRQAELLQFITVVAHIVHFVFCGDQISELRADIDAQTFPHIEFSQHRQNDMVEFAPEGDIPVLDVCLFYVL
jgi:hypothetical protein